MEPTEIEAMFKHLGLTRYEAKAMITLLNYGKCTADRVTSLSAIPLPRVYDTMNSLAKRGFISVSRTRPETFKAIDPKRLFDILIEEEKKKMQKRVTELKDVMPQIMKHIKKLEQTPEEETEEILALVKKRVNMRKDRDYFHSIAKKEMLVFAGDISWIRHAEDAIRSTIRRKVKYNVIYCKKNKASMANARKLKKLGAKVKHYADTGDLRCIVVDKKWISIVLKKFKTAGEPEYSIININNSLIAEVFAKYFYSLWEKAK